MVKEDGKATDLVIYSEWRTRIASCLQVKMSSISTALQNYLKVIGILIQIFLPQLISIILLLLETKQRARLHICNNC